MRLRAITNDEGNKPLRIVRHSSGSLVTWRRAQTVLMSAQGMDVTGLRLPTGDVRAQACHDRYRRGAGPATVSAFTAPRCPIGCGGPCVVSFAV